MTIFIIPKWHLHVLSSSPHEILQTWRWKVQELKDKLAAVEAADRFQSCIDHT